MLRRIVLAALTAVWMGTHLSPAVAESPDATAITFDQAIHFSAPDGTDTVAGPGAYRVQPASESRLRLVPLGAQAAVVIQATGTTHQEKINEPTALWVPAEHDDHHILLLLPDGRGIEATGSANPVRARGTLAPIAQAAAPLSQARIAAAVSQPPPSPSPQMWFYVDPNMALFPPRPVTVQAMGGNFTIEGGNVFQILLGNEVIARDLPVVRAPNGTLGIAATMLTITGQPGDNPVTLLLTAPDGRKQSRAGVFMVDPDPRVPVVGPPASLPVTSWSRRITDAAKRFIVLGEFNNQAVLDQETGLVWQRTPGPSTFQWRGALRMCSAAYIGGRGGWRLPSFTESRTLVDYSDPSSVLPAGHPFSLGPSLDFWTSTTSPPLNGREGAFKALFDDATWADGHLRAWCVRGPIGGGAP